ncbi:unnamed protein product [Schistosoma margrebowiei]|uniref:Uncharacterized protein n=1 Tax=Schistosoma margrebowiei TaxID=48269 RepID=A0A183LKI0_9TREM|nr:unnamed protein product [Schistosoma margrebowiei]
MKLKLKKHWTMGRKTAQMFYTTFLQDTNKLNKFKIVLSIRFQTFNDLRSGEGTTVEINWKGLKVAITSTCHEVLGHKNHHNKEWITVDTLDKIQERRDKKAAINTSRTRAEKAKAQAEYTEVNKQVKKSIRTDKRKYVEDLAKTTEKVAREGNMRQLFDTTKKLSGNRRKPKRPVKSKEGEENTTSVAAVGISICKGKSKILRYNTACSNRFTLDREDLEDIKDFTYLSTIDKVKAAYL